jgi:cell shape-determining protein MreC
MNQSLRIVLVLNLLIFFLGLTPAYSFVSTRFRLVSRPLETGLTTLNQGFISGLTFILSLPKIYRQNLNLKEEVISFREIESKYNAVLKENEMLREQLKLTPGLRSEKLVMAKVLSQDSSSSSLILDIGKENGIAEGNLVTYKGLLLGRITHADSGRSRLLLTISPQSRFEAITSSLLARGETVGDFGNKLSFTKVLPTQTLKVGDTVLELGSRLILGKVENVQAEGAKIFKTADVSVFYDPAFLSEVFILVN